MSNVMAFVLVVGISHGFEFSLRIPRSRSGNFYPVLLGFIRSENEDHAKLFNLLYTKGLTTTTEHKQKKRA